MKRKSKEIKAIEKSVIIAITSIGGWAILFGLIELFNIRSLHPIYLILLGILIIFISSKLGLKKMFK